MTMSRISLTSLYYKMATSYARGVGIPLTVHKGNGISLSCGPILVACLLILTRFLHRALNVQRTCKSVYKIINMIVSSYKRLILPLCILIKVSK